MVVQEFIDRMNKMEVTTYVGLDDTVDRLSFLITVWFLALMCSVTTAKTYFLSPVICYIPNIVGSHEGQAAYITNYCYTEGTYNVPLAEFKIENHNKKWLEVYEDRKIYYYQWLPFILGLQGIMCYLPRLIWLLLANNRTGIDLQQMIKMAFETQRTDSDKREKLIRHVANQLQMWLRGYKPTPSVQMPEISSSKSNINKSDRGSSQQGSKCCTLGCSCCCSKPTGVCLCLIYFMVKLLYIVNSFGQLFMMTKMLQLSSTNANKGRSLLSITATFGLQLFVSLLKGQDWQNHEAFPRSGCCAVETRQSASSNYVFAQCALPVNMLHEKFYIFLWFWFVVLSFCSSISLVWWLKKMLFFKYRAAPLKKLAKLAGEVREGEESQQIKDIARDYLRPDGCFVFHMIASNCGDVVAADIFFALRKMIYPPKDTPSQDALLEIAPSENGRILRNAGGYRNAKNKHDSGENHQLIPTAPEPEAEV